MNQRNGFACLLMLILVIVLAGVPTVQAESSGDECLRAVVEDISPSSVGRDEEFTVGISLENCGTQVPEDITFAIISIPPDIIVIEDLVAYIPQFVYQNSERQLRYHMRTTPDAIPGPHIIKMKLTYGNDDVKRTEYYEVEVVVTGEHAEPRISSISTDPEYIYEGDTVDLDLEIENFGDSIAKSVVVNLNHGFKGITSSTIGAIAPEGKQTALFKFKANNSGTFDIPVIIEYEDDYGIQKDEYNIKITVLDRKSSLNLASVKVNPVLPQIDDTVELTMRIENSGDRTINSIRVYADHPFQGLKESFIGTLDPDEDGPAVITFVADQSGEFEIPVTITYIDDFGEEQVETKVNVIIMEQDDGSGTIIIVLLLLAVIGGLAYNNYRTKKSKDDIIKQLMEGGSSSAEDSEE
ncbi:COG1361 S-layer family protein [Methanolobus sediminis]|uniref:COG1361 S-layer family protein n=1 Tax=Methanolobus sediminis TaxID=3072978 RepID=A0AA51YLP2_9EURY|nr:COG1361 S-layer family protein [Methanolobus sediminis]WMW25184.1 COG1361 S-layer family protein [Methanolobus sediminis]